ncbi:MAG: YdcH family protein [Minicystis sp.]
MKQFGSLRAPKVDGHHDRRSLVEAHHRELDHRLKELGKRPFLTPTEQLEIAELKKHKLKVKDELLALKQVV